MQFNIKKKEGQEEILKRFVLNRKEDVSGVSGVGVVAEGVEFSDGSAAIRWLTAKASTTIWNSVDDAVAIHGHGGLTEVEYIDA